MIDPENGKIFEGMDGLAAWLPITDADQEGVWIDKRTGESPEEPLWLPGEPTGSTDKNCALMVVMWRGWTAWSCVVPKSEPMNCACLFPQMPYLTMRGLCKDSKLERIYLPQNYHANGQLMYYGILKSRIEYVDQGWRLRTRDNTTAVSKAKKVSFLIGKSEWLINGESPECAGGRDSFSSQLKLTGCRWKISLPFFLIFFLSYSGRTSSPAMMASVYQWQSAVTNSPTAGMNQLPKSLSMVTDNGRLVIVFVSGMAPMSRSVGFLF